MSEDNDRPEPEDDDDGRAFIEGYAADVTPQLLALIEREYLPLWITAATTPRPGHKTTSVKAARELSALAALCLERGQPIPRALRQYLARAHRAIAEGQPADKALRLRRTAGQKPADDPLDRAERERSIVGQMAVLVARGVSVPAAKERACERYGIDTRTADRYWKEHGPTDDDLAEIRRRLTYRHRPASDTK
jgi:hypothetical protein